MLRAFLMIVVTVGFLFSCKKEEPERRLPPITQSGEGTFGCLVNGEVWLAGGDRKRPSPLSVLYDGRYKGGYFDIDARFEENGKSSILSIGGSPITKPGRYAFDKIDGDPGGLYASFTCSYIGKETYVNGYLEITRLDFKKRIAAGTFEFTLTNPECDPDTVYITDGRFDLIF